ncbi:hypothetical protein C8046_10845 [Serinibacter arcticus]|uniref:Uncharacterized protein n=1 Tax=Serinibacter arcticus TaxID=1655435 RepID=A0A2U1ZVR8_9MICO|nr:hypothetical protein [Serinibacter arcticus]PWD51069.1 hypothetical protein C8046_10845 [Serinibacter arcticus]
MNSNRDTNSPVKVRVVLATADGHPLGENLWAVHQPGLPERYTLHNNAFGASLRLGDVVRTELDGCGKPQVVAVASLHPGPVSVVELPPDLPGEEICRIADSWRTLGAEYSEGNGDMLVTAWVATATAQSVCEVIAATAPGWRLVDVATTPIRAARLTQELDVRVDRRTPADLRAEHDAVCDCERRQP